MNKLARFMEHFWLAVAIGTGLVAIWMTALEPGREAVQWWAFPAIALAMFFGTGIVVAGLLYRRRSS